MTRHMVVGGSLQKVIKLHVEEGGIKNQMKKHRLICT